MAATELDEGLKLDRQLCFAVYAAAHAYNRLYKPLLDTLGLTYPQYLVMLVLWEGDALTVKAIGRKLMLDSGTLTPLLKRLEAAGLVTRTRDARDERQVRIALTPQGRALKARATAVPPQIAEAFGGTEGEARALKQSLVELRHRLGTKSS
jgi:DNA-binding MarR family transcriptional regulator